MGANKKTTPADLDGAEAKPKKQQTVKGNSKAKGRAMGKTQQAKRRDQRISKHLKGLEHKRLQLLTRGKSTAGIDIAIAQAEHALANPHKTTVTKDGILGGGKKAPLENPRQMAPGERPAFFWHHHQRVWGGLAKNLHEPNGTIVTNDRVRKYYEDMEKAMAAQEVSA